MLRDERQSGTGCVLGATPWTCGARAAGSSPRPAYPPKRVGPVAETWPGDGDETSASEARGLVCIWMGAAAPAAIAVRGVANDVAFARPGCEVGGAAMGVFTPISSGRGPPTFGVAIVRSPPTVGVAIVRSPPTVGLATTRSPPPFTPGFATTRPPFAGGAWYGRVCSWMCPYVGPERTTYVAKPGW